MSTTRLMLIIALVTFLGLITAWQQIQTTRWGYCISEVMELKKQILEEKKTLEIQLTHIESPRQLLAMAQEKRITLDYPANLNIVNILKYRDNNLALSPERNKNNLVLYSVNKE